MTDKDTKEIIKLLRKQNSILINIYKKLSEDEEEEAAKAKAVDIPLDMIPKLTSNERTLELCHVVKDGNLYTFNRGICVECRKASNFEQYVYRSADNEEKKD